MAVTPDSIDYILIVEPERNLTTQTCKCWSDNHMWFQIEPPVITATATNAAIDYERAYLCTCCGAHRYVCRG